MNLKNVGIGLGRFQVSDLHAGHDFYLRKLLNHDYAIVLVGVAQTLGTEENPMDYLTRKLMLEEWFETNATALTQVTIMPIVDIPGELGNNLWSKQLDDIVTSVYGVCNGTLYGGRGSSLNSYVGKFKTKELHFSLPDCSGTTAREFCGNRIINSSDFRSGVIYSAFNVYPTVYPTVDIVLRRGDLVLLGKKKSDAKYRFIGGFVDVQDSGIEETVRREAKEETSLEVGNIQIIGGFSVNDSRYMRAQNRSVMTFLCTAEILFGRPTPGDDIDEIKFFNFSDILQSPENFLIPAHSELLIKSKLYFGKN